MRREEERPSFSNLHCICPALVSRNFVTERFCCDKLFILYVLIYLFTPWEVFHCLGWSRHPKGYNASLGSQLELDCATSESFSVIFNYSESKSSLQNHVYLLYYCYVSPSVYRFYIRSILHA